MSMKQAYEQKLQDQLDEFGAEIDKLQAKADKAGAEARIGYHKQIGELRTLRDDASHKLSELKNAGDEAWEDLKAGIDNAWTSLGASVKSARARFN